ncbi:MAG: SIMPL domain-containing protein [Chloroflexota bacterium]
MGYVTRNFRLSAAIAISMVLVLALGFMGHAVSARGNAAPATNHTLSVSGHGQAAIAPDMATVTVGVQSKAQDAQTALSRDNQKMSAVIDAVKGQGISASHIQTSQLSLWYDSEHQEYVASHTLTVRVDSIGKTGPVLDAAVLAGADSSWGVSFGVKDPSVARSDALKGAIADARKRADTMAAALEVTVTGVGSASEATYSNPPIETGGVRAGVNSAPVATPIQPGEITVTADVNVVYSFG